jgi:secretion/DNA translocation related TadE-like protein
VFRFSRGESGQISILVLAISIALLMCTSLIGMIAEVLVAQQRLNYKAEAIALAGAQELEFNQEQACVVAQEFSTSNFGITAECLSESASVEILLSESNPSQFLSVFIPNIQATSRAGIAGSD